jgi:BirA family biotin operon repressor/biotin-[acetyl-CoA-carboxylase] ligase
MGAVAVASSIRKQLGLPAGIKWPNDILISGKKVSGLLTEMSAEPDRIRHIVLGIGVNVNMDLKELPPAVRSLSTSLAAEAGRTVDRTRFLRELLIELDHWYACFLQREADVLSAWDALNVTLGKRVAVSGAGMTFEGIARGIDAEGRLMLLLDDGTSRQVAAGDVTLLKR